MTCSDCGGPLPARPFGRPTPHGPVPVCALCLVRWRDSDRGIAWLPLLGWVVLVLLTLFCVGIVTR